MYPNSQVQPRIGVWLAGAKGDIAATMMVGAFALKQGLISEAGLTTQVAPMNQLPLGNPADLVFGGIDISPRPLLESASHLYSHSKTISREILDAVTPAITRTEEDILVNRHMTWRPARPNSGLPTLRELTDGLTGELRNFQNKHGLDHVVVVNVTSSEPEPATVAEHDTLQGLESLIDNNRKGLVTPSICYVYAAFQADCSYINFTPNAGTTLGAVEELARQRNLPYYGNDGKTGETLVKTALAPMFASRNLRVLSWEGTNLLGNNDGKALDNPENRTAKMRNKGNVLDSILGYTPHSGVDINFVPSLGDWKTAWDLIHFQGFLDVRMSMQFTWQGCDSILAAPLVLDMVRLAEFAARNGESGPMHHLAAFFKNPIQVKDMALHTQYDRLLRYTEAHLSRAQVRTAKLDSVR